MEFGSIPDQVNNALHGCEEIEGNYLVGGRRNFTCWEKLFAYRTSNQQKLCLANGRFDVFNFLISLQISMEIILPVNIVKRGHFDDLFVGLITETCKDD